MILSFRVSLLISGSRTGSAANLLPVSSIISRFSANGMCVVGLVEWTGFGGAKYDSLDGGGGMKGLRTKETGLGRALGTRGASAVLLKAAMRSRKEDFSLFG